jgi:hypothetical protein
MYRIEDRKRNRFGNYRTGLDAVVYKTAIPGAARVRVRFSCANDKLAVKASKESSSTQDNPRRLISQYLST